MPAHALRCKPARSSATSGVREEHRCEPSTIPGTRWPHSTPRASARCNCATPASLNIVGSAAIADLREALQALAAEPELRVLVLRGSGDKAFIGGADIGEMAALDAGHGRGLHHRAGRPVRRGARRCRCR